MFTGKELAQYCQEAGFLIVELRDRHVFALETLVREDYAPDPFDRILVAQAKAENMNFLTHDLLIPYYKGRCILPVYITKIPLPVFVASGRGFLARNRAAIHTHMITADADNQSDLKARNSTSERLFAPTVGLEKQQDTEQAHIQ